MVHYILKQEEQTLRQVTLKCKIEEKKKIMLMSPKDTSVTQSILCLIFLMYVRTIQLLNCGGQESKKTICTFSF